MSETVFYNNRTLVGIGSVGIGTTNPSYKFVIDNGSTSSINTVIQASGITAGQSTSILLGKALTQANCATILWNHVGDGLTTNYLGLGYYNGDNKLNVTAGGNVGIGTTNPTSTFEVIGGNIKTYKGSDVARLILGPAPSATNLDYCSLIESISTTATNYASVLKFYTHGTGLTNADPTFAMIVDANQRVGIGTTNPQSNLHVSSTGGASVRIESITSGNGEIQYREDGTLRAYTGYSRTGGYYYFGASVDALRLYAGASGAVSLQPSAGGNVGIGITNPGYGLEVVGTFRTSTTMTFSGGAGGGVRYVQVDNNGTVGYLASDARLKSNITPITYGLDTVLQLNPVTFNWKDSNVGGPYTDMGFIAQEVEPLIPEVVRVDSNGIYSLNLPNINAVLTKALQELSAKVTSLEQSLATVTANFSSLEARLAAAGL